MARNIGQLKKALKEAPDTLTPAELTFLRKAVKAKKPSASEYEEIKRRAAARAKSASAEGRDIGAIPKVAHPRKKAKARGDFRYFCEAYLPETYYLPWSPDHLKVIAKIQQAVLSGGLFAMAMPRGSGKTSLAETACIWAMLTGACEFVCLVGSDAGHARNMLESIKVEFETNERLLEDYPEAVFPIHALERIHNRAKGQLCNGRHTRIVWTADEIVLPTIPRSKASAAIIRVAGIESRIRGMKFKRADGRAVRPSLVVLDDPQTDESARSLQQTQTRLDTLNGAILNLAGPGQKISGIMPCTVIRPDDLADRILDRDKHPVWQGERTKLVYKFPKNEKLWAKYADLRADSFKNDGDGSQATEFYRKHQKKMDAGAKTAWAERFNDDELSALQHAMNLKIRDERAFWAEYQNEPQPEIADDAETLKAPDIASKTNGHKRRAIPIGCSYLTMFIDIQGKALFFTVAAWEDDFTGYVVDYGTYPDQKRPYFTLNDIQRTLLRAAPGTGLEGSIYAGLEKITNDYLSRQWRRDDGALIKIERCIIDANWGPSTDVVYQFSKQSAHSTVIIPSHGVGVGASSRPFSEYKKKRGERIGHHWRMPNVRGRRQVRHILVDVNYWKSFIHSRLAIAMGDKGCLSLFGSDSQAHQLFAEHLTAEHRIQTEGRGRTVDEWKLTVKGTDNHWFDCLVGCAVGGAMLGAALPGVVTAREKKKPIVMSQVQRRRKR